MTLSITAGIEGVFDLAYVVVSSGGWEEHSGKEAYSILSVQLEDSNNTWWISADCSDVPVQLLRVGWAAAPTVVEVHEGVLRANDGGRPQHHKTDVDTGRVAVEQDIPGVVRPTCRGAS